MATGPTDASTVADDESERLAQLLRSEEPLSIIACPTPRQVLAALLIAGDATGPIHLRIIGCDRPPIGIDDGGTIATAAGIADTDVTLSTYTPLADVESVVTDPTGMLATAIEVVKAVDTEPTPGIVATHNRLQPTLKYSIRWPKGTIDAIDRNDRIDSLSSESARQLSSSLVTNLLSTTRPSGVSQALQTALAPTRCEVGPTPTAEGLIDVLTTVAEYQPGRLLAAFLQDDGWEELISTYEAAVPAIRARVDALPDGTDADIADAPVDDRPMLSTARCWASSTLDAPYGLLHAGDTPAQLTLVATGDRSASAVLETVVNRNEGTSWGDPFVASAILPSRPADPITMVEEAL